MSTGKVKFFNETKGFGFITPDNGDKDLFVHISAVESGQLNDDDQVEFEVGEGQKGPCAVQVRKI
jgi:CspA family cold shock protein